jgi:hypothetical protein
MLPYQMLKQTSHLEVKNLGMQHQLQTPVCRYYQMQNARKVFGDQLKLLLCNFLQAKG